MKLTHICEHCGSNDFVMNNHGLICCVHCEQPILSAAERDALTIQLNTKLYEGDSWLKLKEYTKAEEIAKGIIREHPFMADGYLLRFRALTEDLTRYELPEHVFAAVTEMWEKLSLMNALSAEIKKYARDRRAYQENLARTHLTRSGSVVAVMILLFAAASVLALLLAGSGAIGVIAGIALIMIALGSGLLERLETGHYLRYQLYLFRHKYNEAQPFVR